MNIILDRVKIDEKDLLFKLLQYSLFEESMYDGNEMNDNGIFEYKDFDDYFDNDKKISFLIKEKNTNKLLGFVMISINEVYTIDEFMIIPKYRHNNIGKKAAIKVFNMYKGVWKVSPSFGSYSAYNFWKKVIDEYTDSNNEFNDNMFSFSN